jgi:hypothetical protein
MDLTVSGGVPAPFARVDNRTFVLCSGPRAAAFLLSSSGVWVEETLMIILDDGRATRVQSEHVLGGFRSEDGARVTLYGGARDELVAVDVSVEELEALQRAVTEAVHHTPPPPHRRR